MPTDCIDGCVDGGVDGTLVEKLLE